MLQLAGGEDVRADESVCFGSEDADEVEDNAWCCVDKEVALLLVLGLVLAATSLFFSLSYLPLQLQLQHSLHTLHFPFLQWHPSFVVLSEELFLDAIECLQLQLQSEHLLHLLHIFLLHEHVNGIMLLL